MWIAIVAVIAVIVIWAIVSYNGLVGKKFKVENSWSQIEVQLQRRFDLIPNLVNTVKGYMQHEQEVLTKVTELRSAWTNAKSVDEKVDIDNQLAGALKTIFAVTESYPDLKANENFIALQEELKDTENKIAYSRQFYNDSVTIYNTALSVFPSNIIASMFGFKAKTLFVIDNEEAKQNVKVDFGNNNNQN